MRRSVPGRPPWRPTKIEESAPRILELLRKGIGRERSARSAGVHDSTFHAWMAKGLGDGEAGDGLEVFRQFRLDVLEAEDAFVRELMESTATDALLKCTCTLCGGREDKKCEAYRPGRKYVHELRDRLGVARFIGPARFPDDFSATRAVRLQGPDGGAVQVKAVVAPLFSDQQLAGMSAEQLAAAIGAFVGGGTAAGGEGEAEEGGP